MAFCASVSQQSVACSLEILSRLLAQIYLLKTRLWFVSTWALGLWQFPEGESADRHFFSQLGTGLERRISLFPLLTRLQSLQQGICSCLVPGVSCRCEGQAVSDHLHSSAAAMLMQKRQICIVCLTPLLEAEGSFAAF